MPVNEKVKRGEKSKRASPLVRYMLILCLVNIAILTCVVLAMLYACVCAPVTVDSTLDDMNWTNRNVIEQLTATAIAAQSATDAASTPVQCYWMMASGSSPEYTAVLQTALESAGITDATVEVGSNGEDFVCGEGENATREFHPTGNLYPRITIPVAQPLTPAEAGARIEQILTLMADTPLRVSGWTEISFMYAGTVSRSWAMNYEQAREAIKNGVHGAALYEFNPNS